MKPEQEYIARQLANTVLYGDGLRGQKDTAGVGVVEVHMKGMVHEIRQQILVDHISLAGKVADEIDRAFYALRAQLPSAPMKVQK